MTVDDIQAERLLAALRGTDDYTTAQRNRISELETEVKRLEEEKAQQRRVISRLRGLLAVAQFPTSFTCDPHYKSMAYGQSEVHG